MRRTVRCHYCYQSGHNRRTCPALHKVAAENPDSYAAKQVALNATKGKDRACSYCKSQGHNRATCSLLKNDRFKAVCDNQLFRNITLDFFKEYGIGLGTLLSFKVREYGQDSGDSLWSEKLVMVEHVEWDQILYNNDGRSIIVNENGEKSDYLSFVADKYFFEQIRNGEIKVEVRAEPENIGLGIPDDWSKGISNIKQAFSDWV